MIKTAVMGYGTIGSGVAEILEENRDVIAGQAGQEVELKYVLDLREFPGQSGEQTRSSMISRSLRRIQEVEIVVETMGGLNPAYPFVKACLMAGKACGYLQQGPGGSPWNRASGDCQEKEC
ncbi:MAG: hypothetical protein ACLTW9_18615 [Enterocloster sp.]